MLIKRANRSMLAPTMTPLSLYLCSSWPKIIRQNLLLHCLQRATTSPLHAVRIHSTSGSISLNNLTTWHAIRLLIIMQSQQVCCFGPTTAASFGKPSILEPTQLFSCRCVLLRLISSKQSAKIVIPAYRYDAINPNSVIHNFPSCCCCCCFLFVRSSFIHSFEFAIFMCGY